jgi:hypothetical protein
MRTDSTSTSRQRDRDRTRLYQLVRQRHRIADRTLEIDFQATGADAYVFTFGQPVPDVMPIEVCARLTASPGQTEGVGSGRRVRRLPVRANKGGGSDGPHIHHEWRRRS